MDFEIPMIPRIIHYCWFGRGPMPELALKCIESWHKYMPDFEYKLWNEDNFDINCNAYVKEAYEARKFAFVTDYVRLYALYTEGGIYMDTDVEILRPLGELMELPAFTGYEASMANAPVTGLMASAPHGIWVREQLAYYEGKHFVNPDGSLDLTPNTVPIANIMVAGGFVINGKYQVYKNDMHVFPVDYFCPLTSTRVLKLTKNTYCIHHFAGSWVEKTRGQIIKDWIVTHIIGRKLTDKLVQAKRRLHNVRKQNL